MELSDYQVECFKTKVRMAFVMEFDSKNNILRGTLEGQVIDAILLQAYPMAADYVASHGSGRAIANFSAVTKFEVSGNAIRELARSAPAIPAGHMRIVVAPVDSMYGMVRMFQILTELTRPDLHAVHFPNVVLTIRRESDDLSVQENDEPRQEVLALPDFTFGSSRCEPHLSSR